jgi:hypothetical protein
MTRKFYSALDLVDQNKIINVGNPTNPQDAATKSYVDGRTPRSIATGGGVATLDARGQRASSVLASGSGVVSIVHVRDAIWHRGLPISYISGTGTTGTDNTAMTIKTLVLPANTLSKVGDRMRVRAYFKATGGAPIDGSTKVGPSGSEVLCSDTTVSVTNLALTECWLQYIDNTHANVVENHDGALGPLSDVNVSGFDWDSDQNIIFTQNAVTAQHIDLYSFIVDLFPAT